MYEYNNNGMQYSMPVMPAGYGNGGFGDGFGGGYWLFFLLFWMCGFGNGGFMGGMDGLYPWMNQANQTNDGFRDQFLNNQLNTIQQNQNNNAMDAIRTDYQGQINALQRSFDAQSANTAALNGIQGELANCCCQNRAQSLENTQAILTAITGGIQSVKDQLCQDKIEQKNDTIAQLRQELSFSRLLDSQNGQTATIQAGQRALANEVEQYVAPKAVPAYIVQNPSCCNTGCNGMM